MSSNRLVPRAGNTDLVTFTINVNGTAIPLHFLVLSLTVNKVLNKIPTARIYFVDGDVQRQNFPISENELFVPGNAIEILLGYHSKEETVFKGIITKQAIKIRRGGSQLLVECKDEAVKLTLGNKSKYFIEKTDKEIVEEIIGEYGLEQDIQIGEVVHQELVQFEMTDWDFLLTRIEANGGVVSVEDGKINALAPAIGEEALEVQYGASIEEFDAEMDARWQHTSVTAYSWDYAAGEAIEAAATEPELEEAGNLQISTLSEVIGLESYNLYHTGQVVQEELQAWADAKLLKTRLSKIRGRVKFQGFAALKPSDTLLLTGVGERMSGKVYVSGVRHELSNGSWYTDAQFGLKPEFFSKENSLHPSKAGGLLAAVNGLQIGVVTQLEEDPTGEERIKVKLPIISAEEDGIWARVASFDAGAEGRGAFFRPEVEDEVIVGFLNDDPRDPIVLGMLYSSGKAAPIVATAENNESGIFTKGKMKFVLNDEAKSIAMETESGNSLLISEEEGGIILKDENGNQISLNSSGITIESAGTLSLAASSGDVKIEGINIEQAAQAQFKAEGAAGLEVSSSAVAVLKGALVQIN